MYSTIKNVALMGMMTATLEAAKTMLAFLPNIELVTLLIILYTLYFGKKIFLVIPAFIILDGLLYGLGLWWVMYMYSWPLLAALVLLFRRQKSPWFWSILSASFGLSFGALCAVPYLIAGGPGAALSWWIAGIPYDIIHCISNFVLCRILFNPLKRSLFIHPSYGTWPERRRPRREDPEYDSSS